MDTYNTAWSEVQEWITEAKNAVDILPVDKEKGINTFQQMMVTPRSLMGTIVLETGGVLIDHGWLRFPGSGSQKMPKSVLDWNINGMGLKHAFIAAYDVLGGFFAINGGAFSGKKNEIFYWQPNALKWLSMQGSYSKLFSWALMGDLEQFYRNMRWPGWQDDVSQLKGDQGFSIFPFLWTKTAMSIADRSKRAIAMEELWHLGQDAGQLKNPDES